MGKLFKDGFLNDIRNVSIFDVASEYFELNEIGAVYQAKCIHKGDNSPSLTFFKATNTFCCFGCGAGKQPVTEGSDVISFVMWVEKCSFIEAVRKICLLKGIQIPTAELSEEDKRKNKMYDEALYLNRLFYKDLQSSTQLLNYLFSRGFTQSDIEKFRIGSVPDTLKSQHHHKIVFPLIDISNRTIGFSYRNMHKELGLGKPGPKYINSSSSLIFDKGSLFYGLNFVKKMIREKDYVVIGEGFSDCIFSQRNGIPFISTMGTSLTDKHIDILSNYTKNIILWPDGDNAGINAAKRQVKALEAEGFKVKIVLYKNQDPDEVILSFEEEEMSPKEIEEKIKDEALLPNVMFMHEALAKYDSEQLRIRIEVINEIKPFIKDLSSYKYKKFLIEDICHRLRIDEETLYDLLEINPNEGE